MTFRGARRRSWVVVAMCGALILAGCTDGSSAGPTASPSLAPTASSLAPEPTSDPTPSATNVEIPLTPPVKPAAMANDDEAGARAAAEYFVELYGYAVQSQDLVEFIALCDPASKFCNGVIDGVNADLSGGIRTVGGSTLLRTYRVDLPAEDLSYSVWGWLDREPFAVLDEGASVLHESEGESDVAFAVLVEHSPDGSWRVRGAEAEVVPAS